MQGRCAGIGGCIGLPRADRGRFLITPLPSPSTREKKQRQSIGRRSAKACRLTFSARATKFYPRPACRHALPAWSKGKSSGRGRREVARGGACSQHAGEGSERCDEYCHSGYVLRWAPCKSRLLGALMKTSIRVQSRFFRMRMGAALSEGLQGI